MDYSKKNDNKNGKKNPYFLSGHEEHFINKTLKNNIR